jgi:hypothetical protein
METLRTGQANEARLREAVRKLLKTELPSKIRGFNSLIRFFIGEMMKTGHRASDVQLMQAILEDEIKAWVIMEPMKKTGWFKLSLRSFDEKMDEAMEDEKTKRGGEIL